FQVSNMALYVSTGPWNHSGDLGSSNGYSTLPGAGGGYAEGTVLEDWVSTNTLLVSHETGHLIGGLAHTTDPTNLMNHMVTNQTTQLTPDQCNQTLTALKSDHPEFLR